MSQVLKIIEDNHLKIPVGSILHSHSFYNKANSTGNGWEVVNYYVWQTPTGELMTAFDYQIHPALKGLYVNCIQISGKYKLLFEGDVYWKVFVLEEKARYHKIELKNGKHCPAQLLKPYKDIVYANTNFYTLDCVRFETEKEAQLFCDKQKTKKKH